MDTGRRVNPALLKEPEPRLRRSLDRSADALWGDAAALDLPHRPALSSAARTIRSHENYRADYVAMPFDGKRITPSRWPNQPWFVERGNMHGNGNLLILANGSVTDLNSLSASDIASQ